MKLFEVLIIPSIITIIIIVALIEKKKAYDIFLEGAAEGLSIVIKIFPTLVGLFLAIGALRNSGLLDAIIKFITPVTNLFHIPSEVLPLALLRPISGSGATAVATDIIQTYGPDTMIGIIASVIMGATETTFYTIAVYTSSVNIKNIRYVVIACLIADFVSVVTAVIVCNILS